MVCVILSGVLTGFCHALKCNNTNGLCYEPRSIDNYSCFVNENCLHYVGNIPVQLNPCVFYRECYLHPGGVDENASFIFDGVLNGFRIVDEIATIGSYVRRNYSSILHGPFRSQMSDNIALEEQLGKISRVQSQPFCVHAMGGVKKKDGSFAQ